MYFVCAIYIVIKNHYYMAACYCWNLCNRVTLQIRGGDQLLDSKQPSFQWTKCITQESWLVRTPPDYVKVNFDASFKKDNVWRAMCVVIPDIYEWFMAACNARIHRTFDLLTAKNTTSKHCLKLAQSIGCNCVIYMTSIGCNCVIYMTSIGCNCVIYMTSECMEVVDTMKNGAIME
jgi:hypothetical protein